MNTASFFVVPEPPWVLRSVSCRLDSGAEVARRVGYTMVGCPSRNSIPKSSELTRLVIRSATAVAKQNGLPR